MDPTVSVIIAAYNAGKFVRPVINSILGQSFNDFELIVVDDASTDNSVEIIQSIVDSRILLIRNQKNMKAAQARNRGIEVSRGKFIAICDADDLSMPTRLEVQVNFLENNPEVDVVGTNAYIFDDSGNILGGLVAHGTRHHELVKNINQRIPLIHPSIMTKASWLKKYKYRDVYHRAQDRELFFRSYRDSIFANIPEYLYAYRDAGKINPKKLLLNNWYNIQMRWQNWRDYNIPISNLFSHLVWVGGRTIYYFILAALGKNILWAKLRPLDRNATFYRNQEWIQKCLY